MTPPKLTAVLLATCMLVSAAPLSFAATELASMSSGDSGKPDMSIAAVVGDEAISSYDVANRIKFIVATARISNTPDMLKVIRPQVLRSLVDEKLQVQEAKKNKIEISSQDVTEAIADIEKQRGMPPGTIGHMLSSSGVPEDAFRQQIRAQLMWNKFLIRKVRPNIHISDEELRIATRKYSMNPPKKKEAPSAPMEYKIAVIAMPVEKPGQEASVKALAAKLVQQIRAGASFEEVSRQFSSVAANSGGKIEAFWVRLGQLDPIVAQSINGAQKGTITDPMRNAQGYTVIKVYDTRPIPGAKVIKPAAAPQEEEAKDTEIKLKEILLKMKADTQTPEADVMLQIGGEVAKNPGTCDDTTVANIENASDMDIEVKFNTYMLSEMQPALKELTDNLKQGEISSPMATYEGIRLYMLCGRKATDTKLVNKDVVYGMLIQQKMDLEAQKYMRNLRRETFIDVRQQ